MDQHPKPNALDWHDAAIIVGAVLVCVGVGMIYLPATVILVGLGLVLAGARGGAPSA